MIPSQVRMRPILPQDGPLIAGIIREVLVEFQVPRSGSAFTDPSMEALYTYYQAPRSIYWVLTDGADIWGGGGLAPLENGAPDVCELQKMYFKKEIRGKGWGQQILQEALKQATVFGFRECYLETMRYMENAQGLYRKYGFQYLDNPWGDTGHTVCNVWMSKSLTD